ncbi:MAG: glycerol-3-phosphate ABC transporter permease [Candidatus Thermofonsia Clade 1 bacterium]|jgi:sn-glycerol 3-phosphate transport system permease protein|uniref:Glycerol-3-phosphate ABC transporter permease n=1 Tax=Candidatus Thermofonsia Clade 1 bacterium TaxID=2364210 RepID=A0A2M8PGP5_9CHLR|nr:MAG: glycerol-3-phosphate ABC transporter permease [Candidatus Thermofonsia Clade 1 bacterium]RMF53053.1 MAG: carbohydrate ABC transporter permease [Chloroflexota bacterium]
MSSESLSKDLSLPLAQPKLAAIRRWLPRRLGAHIFLTLACLIVGFPLIYAIIVSTQSNADVFAYRFTFGSALADNLNTVLVARNLGTYMWNTVFTAVAVTVGKTVLSLLAGLAFVYFKFPGKWLVFGFVLLTLMMPTEILIIALLRFVVIDLGWGSTYQALIVPFIASATGTFLFRQHFANIPAELSEAAQLDGANPLQFLWRVLIPISWNTIGALAVIQFVYVWNMYLWPRLVITDSSRQVVQVGLQSLISTDTGLNYGPLMLGAVIASIPPVIVFILLQKQFMSGFALGRDK